MQEVAEQYSLPLIANERCGSWYISPDAKKGSAYFKSTDGHTGQWDFSFRRLNLQLLPLANEYGGLVSYFHPFLAGPDVVLIGAFTCQFTHRFPPFGLTSYTSQLDIPALFRPIGGSTSSCIFQTDTGFYIHHTDV